MINYPFTEKYTMVIAHPDDETIFGFGMLKNAKRIICCSNGYIDIKGNLNTNGKKALTEIGELLNVSVSCLDYPRNFYKLGTEHNQLYRFAEFIKQIIKSEKTVFSHNFWGEYGNLDHILLYQILKTCCKSIITTNICVNSPYNLARVEWFLVRPFAGGKFIGEAINDLGLYNKCKKIYEKYNCWTWGLPPIEKTNLYEIRNYPQK